MLHEHGRWRGGIYTSYITDKVLILHPARLAEKPDGRVIKRSGPVDPGSLTGGCKDALIVTHSAIFARRSRALAHHAFDEEKTYE